MQGRMEPPCTGCMRLFISRYIVCQFMVILRWQHSAVCSVWSWVCAWVWVHLCDSSLSYRLQPGTCQSSPMGTPLLIGLRDQCSWMFVWVLYASWLGHFWSLFLVLFVFMFFFDKEGLIVFITTQSGDGESSWVDAIRSEQSDEQMSEWSFSMSMMIMALMSILTCFQF